MSGLTMWKKRLSLSFIRRAESAGPQFNILSFWTPPSSVGVQNLSGLFFKFSSALPINYLLAKWGVRD